MGTRILSTRILVALPILGALLVIGCGANPTNQTGSGNGSAASEVSIKVRDNVFEPNRITVPSGEPVKVTFENEGQNIHVVEIKGLIDETQLVPSQTRSFTITPDSKTYKLYDENYEDSGMVGKFIGKDEVG